MQRDKIIKKAIAVLSEPNMKLNSLLRDLKDVQGQFMTEEALKAHKIQDLPGEELKKHLPFIIFLVIFLATGLAVYRDYGVSWDEGAHLLIGVINISA